MSQMSAANIKTYVLDHLDIDDDELKSSLLDHWMEDAVIRIIAYFDESPVWLQVEYSFDTVAGQQVYDLDSFAGLITPTPLQAVDEIRGPNYSLTPRSHRQVRESYRVDAPSGRPQEFSQWGRSIYLWPKPSAAETYYILGIRRPDLNWVTSVNGYPDLPEDFHHLIAQWTLSRAYAQQDDIEMADFYRSEFTRELANIASRWISNLTALPMVMNGGRQREPYRTERALGPTIFDWE